jgi:uncharacterized DUF497 family protein
MKISYDPAKRERTLTERDLDFEDTGTVFDGPEYTSEDDRRDYGETRFVTVGLFRGRMVIIVWTPRGSVRHIISFRKANDREKAKYKDRMGGP